MLPKVFDTCDSRNHGRPKVPKHRDHEPFLAQKVAKYKNTKDSIPSAILCQIVVLLCCWERHGCLDFFRGVHACHPLLVGTTRKIYLVVELNVGIMGVMGVGGGWGGDGGDGGNGDYTYIHTYVHTYICYPPPVIYHFRPLKPNLTAAAVKS